MGQNFRKKTFRAPPSSVHFPFKWLHRWLINVAYVPFKVLLSPLTSMPIRAGYGREFEEAEPPKEFSGADIALYRTNRRPFKGIVEE